MRNITALFIVALFSLPAAAQMVPAAKVARAANGALRNAQRFHTASLLTPSKQILNLRFQYKREYSQAVLLYNKIQMAPAVSARDLETDINAQIRNNTLRNTLLEQLAGGRYSSMQQEMEEYFHLTPQLPVFAASADPAESFARGAADYLHRHPFKPSWRLRETIKFGGMRRLKNPLENILYNRENAAFSPENFPQEERAELMDLYRQAEEVNAVIKNFIAKPQLTPTETEELLDALRKSYTLYEDLVTFAQNSPAVRETLDIYNQLAADMEAFMQKHRRAPQWDNPEERELANLFAVLAFNNQANQFEEMVPIMNKLYELTEQYPTCRLKESDTLKAVKDFEDKHHHLPRSVRARDFFDTKPDEALLYEAMLYWNQANPEFIKKLTQLHTLQTPDIPPAF